MRIPEIKALIDRRMELAMGPHDEQFTGYWAVFYSTDDDEDVCDECGNKAMPNSWDRCAHGHTLEEAIANAVLQAQGESFKLYGTNAFYIHTTTGESREQAT